MQPVKALVSACSAKTTPPLGSRTPTTCRYVGMIKKALTLLIAVTSLALSAAPALAAPTEHDKGMMVEVGDRKGTVDLKTKRTGAIVEGDTAWIAISWRARYADATDFRIVAKTEAGGVTISYPTNTDTYSSLMDNDTLSADEIDFTSLRVSIPYGTRRVRLKVTATWVQNGEKRSQDYRVVIPVARFRGDDIAQATKDAGSVSPKDPTWLGVDWTGLAPKLNDVEMTVKAPQGAVITYPGERPFTSLNYDDSLDDGETDVARFLVDATAMTPGSYFFEVEVTYTKGGKKQSVTGEVAFEVTG